MKIVRFLLLIISVAFYCSCSSDTNEIIPEQPAPEDVYFVHYVITCTTNNPNSVKSINVTTGTGNHITQMPFGKESKWEFCRECKEKKHKASALLSQNKKKLIKLLNSDWLTTE